MPTAFKKEDCARVKRIHLRSQRYNKLVGMSHPQRLLTLMRQHVCEIGDLQVRQDPHFLVETGDLLILCWELLLEHKISPDKIFLKCCGRHEKKLDGLIRTELKKRQQSV